MPSREFPSSSPPEGHPDPKTSADEEIAAFQATIDAIRKKWASERPPTRKEALQLFNEFHLRDLQKITDLQQRVDEAIDATVQEMIEALHHQPDNEALIVQRAQSRIKRIAGMIFQHVREITDLHQQQEKEALREFRSGPKNQ